MKLNQLTRQWGILSLIWSCILLLPMGRSWWTGTWQQEYQFYLLIWLIGTLLYPLQLWWFNTKGIFQWSWWKLLTAQFIVGIVLAGTYQYFATKDVVTKPILITQGGDWQGLETSAASFHFIPGDAYSVFYLYFIQAGIALLWVYNTRLQQKEVDEATLKLKLATIQLKALQSELQPHFLFNTLHAANSLMEEDVGKAQLLIEKLSYLLRHYLSIINQQFYTLREEIDFLSEYVEVQQIRSSAPIQLNFSVADSAILVPVVFLQPIIENSIKHGWTDRNKSFTISIACQIIDQYCYLMIEDSGEPIPKSIQEGIGLRNLRDRLSVLYLDDFKFHYEFNGRTFITELTIPINPSLHNR